MDSLVTVEFGKDTVLKVDGLVRLEVSNHCQDRLHRSGRSTAFRKASSMIDQHDGEGSTRDEEDTK